MPQDPETLALAAPRRCRSARPAPTRFDKKVSLNQTEGGKDKYRSNSSMELGCQGDPLATGFTPSSSLSHATHSSKGEVYHQPQAALGASVSLASHAAEESQWKAGAFPRCISSSLSTPRSRLGWTYILC